MSVKPPLDGVMILDLTRVMAGPYATMMLSDLGARVIKVEPPEIGDDCRQFAPFIEGRSANYLSVNRGKESIALDLKVPEDRHIFETMLARADVLTENFRPGVMARLGYDMTDLRKKYPRLICASTSGFGQTGPLRSLPAYDMVIQAMSGLMSFTGPEDGGPCRVGVSIADIGAAMFTATGIIAALYQREQTGLGGHVDVAMLDSVMAMIEGPIARYTIAGQEMQRSGVHHPILMPFEIFHCTDGELIIAAASDRVFERLCKAIGRPDLAQDARFSSNSLRVQNRPILAPEIDTVIQTESIGVWIERLEEAGVPVSPVNTVGQAVKNPQVRAREMLVDVDDPNLGRLELPGTPLKFVGFDNHLPKRPAPELDQHREALLKEFGLQ